MGRGDEDVDVVFVGGEEGVDVVLVDEAGALGLGEDEVGEEEEAEVGVEGEPGCAILVVGGSNGCVLLYQARMNHVHDSTREKQEKTTQYISHGVSCAGSDVRRAL